MTTQRGGPVSWLGSLRGSGLKTRLLHPRDEWGDRRLGIRTFGFTPAVGAPDSPQWRGHYEATPYAHLYRMLRHAQLGADDVYLDLGCGLGRTVFAARHLGAGRAIGVDIDPVLIDACNANLARSRAGSTGIRFIAAPAEQQTHDDTTVLFMFHPFGWGTMAEVLALLQAALQKRPRPLRVVYYNPVCDELFAKSGFLRRTEHWPAGPTPYAVSFWST